MDAAWNMVSVVTGAPLSTFVTPQPLAHSILKSRITATLSPGTWKWTMSSRTLKSSKPCRLGNCGLSTIWMSFALSCAWAHFDMSADGHHPLEIGLQTDRAQPLISMPVMSEVLS
jgi:hypothetical protein